MRTYDKYIHRLDCDYTKHKCSKFRVCQFDRVHATKVFRKCYRCNQRIANEVRLTCLLTVSNVPRIKLMILLTALFCGTAFTFYNKDDITFFTVVAPTSSHHLKSTLRMNQQLISNKNTYTSRYNLHLISILAAFCCNS